jgi:hypothetical protein
VLVSPAVNWPWMPAALCVPDLLIAAPT